ncbi:MAG: hypothetical protein KKE79_08705 [Actinobacteria bacterium]|nr:hypothetical protein [Actinomycetota bacterium]MBU4301739.1 hypothetical protein [Actinomycetota bacterium]MBU4385438.1 hypothetical protein [Actinomycetota bacterium]MBU4490697.1 hypothetical protein [Actinomycetota bacterium]MCG2795831.1 hypothetical protein [Actinomycetes bacterium]
MTMKGPGKRNQQEPVRQQVPQPPTAGGGEAVKREAPEHGGGQDIASRLAPGTRVKMLIRKADHGSLEVVAVRVTGEQKGGPPGTVPE